MRRFQQRISNSISFFVNNSVIIHWIREICYCSLIERSNANVYRPRVL